ncbi:hypothetical protein BOTBODRAFT_60820 [Botryobasidium botryosum FD-172 SS1]|uniref:Uncharacterized protein n=1 Tax=Botryobasidium botryosum (strain FD-172 SS1) TaxID=930990 RepID=A0A067M2Z1_BOTB1|nr:hypothetical protein BOTBODRAFT_60820 [Botryobasidium botryosum FD-172 SS1]
MLSSSLALVPTLAQLSARPLRLSLPNHQSSRTKWLPKYLISNSRTHSFPPHGTPSQLLHSRLLASQPDSQTPDAAEAYQEMFTLFHPYRCPCSEVHPVAVPRTSYCTAQQMSIAYSSCRVSPGNVEGCTVLGHAPHQSVLAVIHSNNHRGTSSTRSIPPVLLQHLSTALAGATRILRCQLKRNPRYCQRQVAETMTATLKPGR